MVKALLVSLLLSLTVTLRAEAVTMLPDHEAFVHLPAAEQKRIIKGVMEFMVAMEAEHETVKAPYKSKVEYKSTELQEKIFSHIRFIQKVLINSAHAATDPFEAYRKKYLDSMTKADNQKTSNVCIYAGWISTINPKTNKCLHPSKALISNYPKPANVGNVKLGPNDIVCNPLMFGFKNPEKKTLLVAVATTASVNSSLDCMNQSQGVNKDGTKNKEEDPKITEARLNQLKLAYTDPEGKATYLRLTKLIHQTCLCPSTLKNMYQPYLDSIRPHRTCFSLLNQYKYLRKNDCSPSAEDLGLNIDVLNKVVEKNLSDMESKVNKFSSKELKTALDVAELKKLDSEFKTLLDKNSETENFCKAESAGKQVCKIKSCTNIKGKEADCKAIIEGSQNPKTEHPVKIKDGTGIVVSIASQSTKKEDVTCSLPEMKCTVREKTEGKYKIEIEGGDLVNPADSKIEFVKSEPKSVEVIPTGLDNKSIFSVTCAAPPLEPVCVVSKCETNKETTKRSCDFTVEGFATKIKDQKNFEVPKDFGEKDFPIELADGKSVRCPIKEDEKISTCTISVAPNKDPTKVDISVILNMVEGDKPSTPKLTEELNLVGDETGTKFTAVALLTTITGKKITMNSFSTKSPHAICETIYPEAPAAPSLELKRTERKDGDKTIYIITATLKVITTYEKIVWKGGSEGKDEEKKTREVEKTEVDASKEDPFKICASHKEVNDGKEVCEEIPKSAVPTPEKPTLSLAGINRSNENFDVKATVTLNGKDFSAVLSDGYTLVWFEKGKPELTVEEKALKDQKEAAKKEAEKKLAEKVKAAKPKGGAGDSDSDTDTKTKTPETKTTTDTKAVDGEVQNGTSITYLAPIGAAKYDICADLMKDGKVVESECKTVPANVPLAAPQMGPPPVPGAYRYRRW